MDEFSNNSKQKHLQDDVLNEYLDGYLTPEDTALMEQHLSTCPTCYARLHQLETLFTDLQDLSDVTLNRDFRRDVLQVINIKPQMPWFVKWSALLQTAIALFILITILPGHFRGWLAAISTAIHTLSEFRLISWINRSLTQLDGFGFSLPSWQYPTLDLKIQFLSLENLNWFLFATILVFLFLINAYLLRQVARNGSQ